MSKALDRGYPPQYESRLTLKNGREVFLRPILPTDGDLLIDLFNRMSPQSIYSRFLRRLHALPEEMLHRFTHIDYDHEFALAAVVKDDGQDAIIAVGRYLYDPDDKVTDFAVAVRDDWQHLGLGKSLLAKIFAVGRDHGISSFVSVIDPENKRFRRILSELGYQVKYSSRSGDFRGEIHV
jgi:acetyltransferase